MCEKRVQTGESRWINSVISAPKIMKLHYTSFNQLILDFERK